MCLAFGVFKNTQGGLIVCFFCFVMFCDIVLYVLSSFTIILLRKGKWVAPHLLYSYLFVLACVLVSPPHCAMGWYTICDCGISRSYSFDF